MAERQHSRVKIFVILSVAFFIALGATLYITQKEVIPQSSEGTPTNGVTETSENTALEGGNRFPKSILADVGRVEIDLSGRGISETIPAEIRQLRKLRVLDVSENSMTNVPAEIGQLAELRILDLSNNKLTGIPQEIGNLQKLEILNVSGNRISETDLEIIQSKLPESTRVIR